MQDFDVSKMRSHLKQCINLQQISMFPTNNNLLSSYFQKQQHYRERSKSDKTANKNDPAKEQSSQMNVPVSQGKNEYQKQRQQPDFKLNIIEQHGKLTVFIRIQQFKRTMIEIIRQINVQTLSIGKWKMYMIGK